jgi:hypothetical protein
MNPLKAFRSQLGKLQRLAQPYFLPVEDTHPWQFLLLVVALVASVVGVTLLLLTGVVGLSGLLIPELQSRDMHRVTQTIRARRPRDHGADGGRPGLLRRLSNAITPGAMASLATARSDSVADPCDQWN